MNSRHALTVMLMLVSMQGFAETPQEGNPPAMDLKAKQTNRPAIVFLVAGQSDHLLALWDGMGPNLKQGNNNRRKHRTTSDDDNEPGL